MTDTPGADEAEFRITRVFDAPRQRVWDAWTKPDQLARWFGPRGVTTKVIVFDLRAGGMLHARMESADGPAMWAKFVYREVAPPSRLAWTHSFADEAANIVRAPFADGLWPLKLLTTVTFEDAGAGTKITLTWAPIEATAEERAAFAGSMESMTMGWTGSFDQLDRFLSEAA